ncbi:MAG: PQQ-binding-like beta-propeller repeat protein [Phycisphaerales bacterium]
MTDQPTAAPRQLATRTGASVAAALLGVAVCGAWAVAATPPAAAPAAPAAPQKSAREILDEKYVMGPTAADALGYRIVWQTDPLATKDATMQVATPGDDSVWFGDSAGSVVRVRRDSGEVVWRSSTYQGLERMVSIDHLPQGKSDTVYVVTEINCVTLDGANGALQRRTSFAQLPSTAPAVYGPYMISGTRTGLVAWYQYATGYNWRATTIGGLVNARVTVTGDVALAGSSKGVVFALDAGSAGVIWQRKLAAGVEATIAADERAAFVASRDQSLWAFDLQRGRVLWQYFTQSPLVNDPVRLGDGLYLQIPEQGLVSFNPHPQEKPDGEVRWKSKAAGDVIGRMGSNLIAWDKASRTFTQVDAGTGRIVEQRALPQVASIVVAPKINGDLYLASEDGRVQRVEPLARPTMTEETTAAAPAGRGKGGLGAPALKGAPAATDAPAAPAAGGAQAIPATQTLNPRPR